MLPAAAVRELAARQEGSEEVAPGLYLQRSIAAVRGFIDEGRGRSTDFRVFLGHAGWGPAQLPGEVAMHTWIPVLPRPPAPAADGAVAEGGLAELVLGWTAATGRGGERAHDTVQASGQGPAMAGGGGWGARRLGAQGWCGVLAWHACEAGASPCERDPDPATDDWGQGRGRGGGGRRDTGASESQTRMARASGSRGATRGRGEGRRRRCTAPLRRDDGSRRGSRRALRRGGWGGGGGLGEAWRRPDD